MNPLIQARPEHHERAAKPQSLKYLLGIAAIVALFVVAAVVTDLIPAADARVVGKSPAAHMSTAAAPGLSNGYVRASRAERE